MTAPELFERMAPFVSPIIEQEFNRRDLCILATRVAIDVAAYFGVHAAPMPVQVILYNEAFARHLADGFAGVDRTSPASWGDGSWSVGIGCGKPERDNGWDGHLIAVAEQEVSPKCRNVLFPGDPSTCQDDPCACSVDWFGDFNIQQAERLQHNIVTGPAVVGPMAGPTWKAINDTGTVIEYTRIEDDRWRTAPDWRDAARRRPLVGKIIRAVKEVTGNELRPAV